MTWFRAEKPRMASEGADAYTGRACRPSAFVRPAVIDGQLTLRERAGVVDA